MWFCIGIGSLLGSLIPTLWGANPFSISSTVFSGLGGLLGIWFAYRIGE